MEWEIIECIYAKYMCINNICVSIIMCIYNVFGVWPHLFVSHSTCITRIINTCILCIHTYHGYHWDTLRIDIYHTSHQHTHITHRYLSHILSTHTHYASISITHLINTHTVRIHTYHASSTHIQSTSTHITYIIDTHILRTTLHVPLHIYHWHIISHSTYIYWYNVIYVCTHHTPTPHILSLSPNILLI